jgi:hypothetical protein
LLKALVVTAKESQRQTKLHQPLHERKPAAYLPYLIA